MIFTTKTHWFTDTELIAHDEATRAKVREAIAAEIEQFAEDGSNTNAWWANTRGLHTIALECAAIARGADIALDAS